MSLRHPSFISPFYGAPSPLQSFGNRHLQSMSVEAPSTPAIEGTQPPPTYLCNRNSDFSDSHAKFLKNTSSFFQCIYNTCLLHIDSLYACDYVISLQSHSSAWDFKTFYMRTSIYSLVMRNKESYLEHFAPKFYIYSIELELHDRNVCVVHLF
jgi:hypothetical protein